MSNIIKFESNMNNNGSYVATEADRENDRRTEEWQERRREESRRNFLRSHQNPYQHKFNAE